MPTWGTLVSQALSGMSLSFRKCKDGALRVGQRAFHLARLSLHPRGSAEFPVSCGTTKHARSSCTTGSLNRSRLATMSTARADQMPKLSPRAATGCGNSLHTRIQERVQCRLIPLTQESVLPYANLPMLGLASPQGRCCRGGGEG
jgi:hypothetical protein